MLKAQFTLGDGTMKLFFDDKKIKRILDREERGLLSKAGAYVYTRVRRKTLKHAPQKLLSQMSPREKRAYEIAKERARRTGGKRPRKPEISAKPGRPPLLHGKKSPLKNLIRFAYSPMDDSVVVGPMLFPSAKIRGVPRTLEEGGRSVRVSGNKRRTIRVRPHPFMLPALKKEMPKFPTLWADSVK